MQNETKILVIDDDVDLTDFIYTVAHDLNLNCIVANNADDFIRYYDSSITHIFMDLNIPNMDGIELLRFVESKNSTTAIILMSGVDMRILQSAKEFAIAKGLSVIGHFQKPIRLKELEDILKNCTATKIENKQKHDIDTTELEITKGALLHATHYDEFVIFYQPKVDIKTQKLIGVEVLIRWQHPKLGLIYPEKFISLAESTGLIDAITWIVIKKAVKEIKLIKQKIDFSLMISFNLSPHSLHDLHFPDKLMTIITEANINPDNIILELTETGLLKEISSALDILTRLRLKKFQLSIDDFGTGYAMMQQLKLIPATEIKIDKSFVLSMLESDASKVSVKKITEMGHELGMKVTAEGVETKAHLQAAHDLKCDIAQGSYYSKPVPINELINWINNEFCQLETKLE